MLHNPLRGEIWRVDLDPTRGAELRKTRPAIVINSNHIGRLPLRLIVPITGWNDSYTTFSWLTRIEPTIETGLTKTSAADAFQVRGVSLEQFHDRIGAVSPETLEQIIAAIAVTIEFA